VYTTRGSKIVFFFGIFGVDTKSKEIKDINNITCKQCGRYGVYRLVKQYSYFHFFFIPLFKWGEKYFVVSRCCKSVFNLNTEKGRNLEQGNDFITIEETDLEYLYGEERHSIDTCPNCSHGIDRSFEFCPYCGKKIDDRI
jgi:hypothetical protein